MTETTKHESVEKIAELIKDIRIAMLVTVDQRRGARSRPMATQDVPFDGTLWFFTSKDSAQAEEIARDPRVNVAYSSPGRVPVLPQRSWNEQANANCAS